MAITNIFKGMRSDINMQRAFLKSTKLDDLDSMVDSFELTHKKMKLAGATVHDRSVNHTALTEQAEAVAAFLGKVKGDIETDIAKAVERMKEAAAPTDTDYKLLPVIQGMDKLAAIQLGRKADSYARLMASDVGIVFGLSDKERLEMLHRVSTKDHANMMELESDLLFLENITKSISQTLSGAVKDTALSADDLTLIAAIGK